jgi:hypothetical protein
MPHRFWLVIGVLMMSLNTLLPQTSTQPVSAASTLDQIAVDTLKQVHNRGAELYNRGDHNGAYRMYEAALMTVKPFLAHRPKIQKTIETSIEETSKTEGTKIQAYRLHEVIEEVRAELKAEIAKANPGQAAGPPSELVPAVRPKPEEAPKPKETATKETPPEVMPAVKATPAPTGVVEGIVMMDKNPLSGVEVKMVSLDLARPRIFSGKTNSEGRFSVNGPLPPSRYMVIVSGYGVPTKFSGTESPLRTQLSGGATATYDIQLQ